MTQLETRPRNHILEALPQAEWERLAPHLKRTLLHQGQVLHEPGQMPERSYFVTAGMISLVLDSQQGTGVEVGLIAREGVLDTLSLVSGLPPLHRAMVQLAGQAVWIPAAVLREEFDREGALRLSIHRLMHVLTCQTAQSALCNRLHMVEARLSRWLLLVSDQTGWLDLDLTHEFLGHMLGTRRSGVTVALGELEAAGILETGRGTIKILNREQLEQRCCECYGVLRRQFELLQSSPSLN